MSKSEKKNIPASVLQQLKNYSEARKEDRGLTLANYAIERLLYRLSVSQYAEQFVLKGAQLFRVWSDVAYRPTRDLDLLRFGSSDINELVKIFQEICTAKTDFEDGIIYLAETVRAEAIREDDEYDGIRVRLEYRIDKTGQFLQVDVGFGDAVNPPATMISYPSMLEMPAPNLKAYCMETVIAEKVEAMVSLGYANSRMKDVYDVFRLSQDYQFDKATLANAIQQTFDRRKTAVPSDPPLCLTREFSQDPVKQAQWNAFISRSSLEAIPFEQVVEKIMTFIMPIFSHIIASKDQ